MDNQIVQSVPVKQQLISIGNIFKKSFGFYKSKLSLVLTLALIPFASMVLIDLILGFIDMESARTDIVIGLGLLTLLFTLFALVINLWAQVALFYAIKEKDAVPNEDAKSLLAFSWNKINSYLWIACLMTVILFGGFMLLIVPGILFYVWFSLALYVFVFEEKTGMQALYRSKELVTGYWWPVFGRLLLFTIIVGLVNVIPFFGSIINIFVTGPLGVMYSYFIYEDLKRIKG